MQKFALIQTQQNESDDFQSNISINQFKINSNSAFSNFQKEQKENNSIDLNKQKFFDKNYQENSQDNLTINHVLNILNCLNNQVIAKNSNQEIQEENDSNSLQLISKDISDKYSQSSNQNSTTVSKKIQNKTIQKDQKKKLVNKFQLPKTNKKSQKGCNCSKTNCLKLYCECFQQGKPCTIYCKCNHCSNKESDEQRETLMRNILVKQPMAFEKKINEKTKRHRKGCKCLKSNCQKKYCECFINGVECSSHCQCANCNNHSHSKSVHSPLKAQVNVFSNISINKSQSMQQENKGMKAAHSIQQAQSSGIISNTKMNIILVNNNNHHSTPNQEQSL